MGGADGRAAHQEPDEGAYMSWQGGGGVEGDRLGGEEFGGAGLGVWCPVLTTPPASPPLPS